MHADRLLHLAELLKDLREAPFDLKCFVGYIDPDYEENSGNFVSNLCFAPTNIKYTFADWVASPDRTTAIPHNCGCVACACGYAGLNKWFMDQGFKTQPDGCIFYTRLIADAADPQNSAYHTTYDSFYSCLEFFEIDSNEFDWLFTPDHYDKSKGEDKNPLVVAERIFDFVRDGGPPENWEGCPK